MTNFYMLALGTVILQLLRTLILCLEAYFSCILWKIAGLQGLSSFMSSSNNVLIISHLCLGFPGGFFLYGFSTTILYAFLIYLIHATCLDHLILLNLIVLITTQFQSILVHLHSGWTAQRPLQPTTMMTTMGEVHRLVRSSVGRLHQFLLISSLLGPNTLLSPPPFFLKIWSLFSSPNE